MSDAVKVVAECELSDGLLAIVKDSLTEGIYHVYKEAKNVQPNHDAEGVMRYMAHVAHGLGYKADKAERELAVKTQQVNELEARVKLLEQMVMSFSTDGPDVNLITGTDKWEVLLTLDGRNLYRKKGTHPEFILAENMQEILNNIYNEEKQ